jgi:hypothetical protein
MNCPECNKRLILESFWQGRYVNCTGCGLKLQRSVAAIAISVVVGIGGWFLTDWVMVELGAPMELEIPVSLVGLAVFFFAAHAYTLKLKPKEDTELKL